MPRPGPAQHTDTAFQTIFVARTGSALGGLEGLIGRPGAFEVFWESPTYSHCNFTALPTLSDERAAPWVEKLLAMDFDNPAHRPILEMEGLRQWVLRQLDGYT